MTKAITQEDTYMATINGPNAMVFLNKGTAVKVEEVLQHEVARVSVRVGRRTLQGYISLERLEFEW